MRSFEFFGIPVHSLSLSEALKELDKKETRFIVTPNPEILLDARRNSKFKSVLLKSDLRLPDGHGLLLVSTLKKIHSKILRAILLIPAYLLFLFFKKPFRTIFPTLIHGSDFLYSFLEWADKNKKSVFFLGAAPGVAEKAAQFFLKKFPTLKVVGSSAHDPNEEAILEVKKKNPDLVIVAYGSSKQEFWAEKAASELPHVEKFICVGGALDFWSGQIKRAPLLFRKLGLEWLWRLFLQPKKRFKRIWTAVVRFPLIALFSDSP